jgi:hypothetical protein
MSSWTVSDSTGVQWLTVTPTRAMTRAMIIAPALVAVIAQQYAAGDSQMWPGAFMLLLAWLSARAPDSAAGAFFIAGYAVWWLLSSTDETSIWSLVAAVSLLAFHSTVAFSAAGPPGQVPDRATVVRWLRDTGMVALATWGLWIVVAGLHGTTQSSEVLLGVSLVLVGTLVLISTGPATELPVSKPTTGGRAHEVGEGYM